MPIKHDIRSAAIAAVDVYNRPGPRFRTAHFIVLIIISWSPISRDVLQEGHQALVPEKKGGEP